MLFSKKKTYEMNMEQANAALQNIFAACNQAPNTIPFDKLVLRQQLNTAVYTRLIAATFIALCLTFFAPLYIVPIASGIDHVLTPEPVKLVSDYCEENVLYLELSHNRILYEEAYIETLDGRKEYAISFDKKTCTIAFPYITDSECNIYIPVRNNEPLHLLLSPQ